jgi:RNA polymerase sigma factor (sigma-70 family)
MDILTENSNEPAGVFKTNPQKTLELFFDNYYLKLNYFGSCLITDRQAVEEIVNDAFVSLWKIRDNFATDHNVRAFLYTTVRRACYNHARKLKSDNSKEAAYLKTVNVNTDENIEAAIDHKIEVPEVLRASEELSEKRKQIFDLIFEKGYTTQQIVAKLELSDSTIRVQKLNIIRQLKQILKDNGFISCLVYFLGSL